VPPLGLVPIAPLHQNSVPSRDGALGAGSLTGAATPEHRDRRALTFALDVEPPAIEANRLLLRSHQFWACANDTHAHGGMVSGELSACLVRRSRHGDGAFSLCKRHLCIASERGKHRRVGNFDAAKALFAGKGHTLRESSPPPKSAATASASVSMLSAEAMVSPGLARPVRREARFTLSPVTVYSAYRELPV
jgi:hypothetical protein